MNITLEALKKYIEAGLKEEVEKQFDEQMKVLNSRKNEVCAGILLNVMQMVEFKQLGDRIIFEIREIK